MKIPERIIVDTTNVHQQEIVDLLIELEDNTFDYDKNNDNIIVSTLNKNLKEVLSLMLSLESDCWKWEEKYKIL